MKDNYSLVGKNGHFIWHETRDWGEHKENYGKAFVKECYVGEVIERGEFEGLLLVHFKMDGGYCVNTCLHPDEFIE